MGGAQVVRYRGGVWEGTKIGCRWWGAGVRCERGSRGGFGGLGGAVQMEGCREPGRYLRRIQGQDPPGILEARCPCKGGCRILQRATPGVSVNRLSN